MSEYFWDDIKSYRPCHPKGYSVYICKPPVGTIVLNSLNAEVVRIFGYKTYFTVSETASIVGTPLHSSIMRAIECGIAFYVRDSDIVVAGVLGELSVDTEVNICKRFCFVRDGKSVPINRQTLSKRTRQDGTMSWQLARPSVFELERIGSSACFIPVNISGMLNKRIPFNSSLLKHGNGDFIISVEKQAGYWGRYVLNGRAFSLMFNNRGWEHQTCTNKTISAGDLPNLFKGSGSSSTSKSLDTLYSWFEQRIKSGELVCYNTEFSLKLVKSAEPVEGYDSCFSISNVCESVSVYKSIGSDKILLRIKSWSVGKYSHCFFDISDISKIRNAVISLCCIQRGGFLTNFHSPMLSSILAKSLWDYTTSAYGSVIEDMWALRFDDFRSWVICRDCYNIVKQSSISGVRIYRGLRLDEQLAVGDIISCDVFTSWSLALTQAEYYADPSGCIVTVNVKSPIEMMYINSFSLARDIQFELLMNPGYRLRVIRKYAIHGLNLFECELERDSAYKPVFLGCFKPDKSLTESNLMNSIALMVYGDSTISDKFCIMNRTSKLIALVSWCMTKYLYIRVDMVYHVIEISDSPVIGNRVSIAVTDFDTTMQQFKNAICKMGGQISYSSAAGLYKFGSLFMHNIEVTLREAGYTILRQYFDSEDVVSSEMNGRLEVKRGSSIKLVFSISQGVKGYAVTVDRSTSKRSFDCNTKTLYSDILEFVCS